MSSSDNPSYRSEKPFLNNSKDLRRSRSIVNVTKPDKDRFPDISEIQSVTLKEGPRSSKKASYTAIENRHTGEIHHYALNIKTFSTKKGQWQEKQKNSITLTSENDDEIQKLIDFLKVTHESKTKIQDSSYALLKVPTQKDLDPDSLQELLSCIPETGRVDSLKKLLDVFLEDTELFKVLIERVSEEPQLFTDAAAALNLATYKSAFDKLEVLINQKSGARESQFQKLLAENPWMFGSEYSEILDRRTWTRDEQQDFVVRRTTDNYIEIIEIKTPLEGKNLFNYDQSHKSYYPSVDLSKVIGQVQNYLEKLDNERNSILANDGEDTSKIRAKIIIGRDVNQTQQKALRRLNGHLHRIEIMTFDQLLRITENVLKYLEGIFIPRS